MTTITDIKPYFPMPSSPIADQRAENAKVQQLIQALNLRPHVEGGYFAEIDRDDREVSQTPNGDVQAAHSDTHKATELRSLSTSILYCLTPKSPIGFFHRNKSRTIHSLHRGRGTYVVLTEKNSGVDTEIFVVGQDVVNGERLQWIVEGGSYKASFLIPDGDGPDNSSTLLISEIVVPGFEDKDHEFLRREVFRDMVDVKDFEKLKWLLRENERDAS